MLKVWCVSLLLFFSSLSIYAQSDKVTEAMELLNQIKNEQLPQIATENIELDTILERVKDSIFVGVPSATITYFISFIHNARIVELYSRLHMTADLIYTITSEKTVEKISDEMAFLYKAADEKALFNRILEKMATSSESPVIEVTSIDLIEYLTHGEIVQKMKILNTDLIHFLTNYQELLTSFLSSTRNQNAINYLQGLNNVKEKLQRHIQWLEQEKFTNLSLTFSPSESNSATQEITELLKRQGKISSDLEPFFNGGRLQDFYGALKSKISQMHVAYPFLMRRGLAPGISQTKLYYKTSELLKQDGFKAVEIEAKGMATFFKSHFNVGNVRRSLAAGAIITAAYLVFDSLSNDPQDSESHSILDTLLNGNANQQRLILEKNPQYIEGIINLHQALDEILKGSNAL